MACQARTGAAGGGIRDERMYGRGKIGEAKGRKRLEVGSRCPAAMGQRAAAAWQGVAQGHDGRDVFCGCEALKRRYMTDVDAHLTSIACDAGSDASSEILVYQALPRAGSVLDPCRARAWPVLEPRLAGARILLDPCWKPAGIGDLLTRR